MFSSCLKYSSVFLSLWPHSPWPSLAADGHTGCVSFLNGPFCFSLSNTLKQYSHLFNVVYFDSPVHDETQCFMLSHLKICHMYNITLHRSTIYWTKIIFFVVLLHPLSPTIVTFNIKWHGHPALPAMRCFARCCCHLQLLLVCFQFCPQYLKSKLCWDEIRSLTWPLKNIQIFGFVKLLVCFCSLLWVTIRLLCEALLDQSWRIWLNLSRECSPFTLHNSSCCFYPRSLHQ